MCLGQNIAFIYLFAHPFQPCLCIFYYFRTGNPRTCAHKALKQWDFSRKQAAAGLSMQQVQEAVLNGVKHFHLASGRAVFKRGRELAGGLRGVGACFVVLWLIPCFCFIWAVRRRLWWGKKRGFLFSEELRIEEVSLQLSMGEPLFLFHKF